MKSTNLPPVVLDIGFGLTKMGLAGNLDPHYIIPTTVAVPEGDKKGSNALSDLDFYIGEEALAKRDTHTIKSPLGSEQVVNWNYMESYIEQVMYRYLRVDPEDHHMVITEPHVSGPEIREFFAEIMFETFNVPGLYIASQATMALATSWTSKLVATRTLTGLVVDVGEKFTHIVPVESGMVINSCIKQLPLGGKDITSFIKQLMKEREGNNIPTANALQVAKEVKEKYCYVCPNIVNEYKHYDNNPKSRIIPYNGMDIITKKPFRCDVGYERFLGPELLFQPNMLNSPPNTTTTTTTTTATTSTTTSLLPLPTLVDDCIQSCPLHIRSALYKNIVLSGYSTTFKDFSRRLQRDVQATVRNRIEYTKRVDPTIRINPIPVELKPHHLQGTAVWFGGSMLASTPEFYSVVHTKEQYEEMGSSICRRCQFVGANGNIITC